MARIVNDQEITHRFIEVEGITFHFVELGEGEPVVLLHGLPESWYSWRYQIPALAEHFRVVAPDLKGYGQSSKHDGDYSVPNLIREMIALIDAIGFDRFRLAGHDWGGVIGSFLGAENPHRIVKYCHMSTPTIRYNPDQAPHHRQFREHPEIAINRFKNMAETIPQIYQNLCFKGKEATSEEELQRSIQEASYPGIAEALPRYFRDMVQELGERDTRWKGLTFPVRFIYPDNDPLQPLDYVGDGLEDVVPGFESLTVIKDSGHFSIWEQPDQVNKAMLEFFLT